VRLCCHVSIEAGGAKAGGDLRALRSAVCPDADWRISARNSAERAGRRPTQSDGSQSCGPLLFDGLALPSC